MKKYLNLILIFTLILLGLSMIPAINQNNRVFGFALDIFRPSQGGTGTSTPPTYGQILVGNSQGTYTLTATSSLGITGSGGGHTIQDEGNSLTQRTFLNFTGTGVSVADSGGKTVVTVAAAPVPTAGSIASPTGGAVNDTNLTFTFASKPEQICIEGKCLRVRSGDSYDTATDQWSWNAGSLTATLPFPVGTGNDIYGTKVIEP